MSDDEWITVGKPKASREGIDTRYKGKPIGAPNVQGERSSSSMSQSELQQLRSYWEQVRAAKEAEEAAREKQKQIEYQRSTRYTLANYPMLVNTASISSRPALSFKVPRVIEPPSDIPEADEEEVYVPPVEIRVGKRSREVNMVDERPEHMQSAEEYEDLEAKFGLDTNGDAWEEVDEWESFEQNDDLGIVGRQFDI